MKKVATFVFAILLGASLSLAQTGGGSTGQAGGKEPTQSEGKKGKSGKKGHHKGGKKGKKGDKGGSTTPAPK